MCMCVFCMQGKGEISVGVGISLEVGIGESTSMLCLGLVICKNINVVTINLFYILRKIFIAILSDEMTWGLGMVKTRNE